MESRLIKFLAACGAVLLVANLTATVFLWVRLSEVETRAKRLKDRLAEREPASNDAPSSPAALRAVEGLRELRSALRDRRDQAKDEPRDLPNEEGLDPEAVEELASMGNARGRRSGAKGRVPLAQLATDLGLSTRQTSDLHDIINEARRGLYELRQSALQGEKAPYIKQFNTLKKKTYADLKLILSPQQYQKFDEMHLGLFSIETDYHPFSPRR